MTPQFVKRWLGNRRMRRAARGCVSAPRNRWKPHFFRPSLEVLEDRTMLDASLPPDIVVGRTLSSYTTGAIQNNQETLTLTVFNEQATSVTGVLLTDTLAPGVTIVSASQQPDQSGQKLAWSMGTIQGYDRASVTLTISLPSPIPLQLDTGAQAYAMLDGASVSNSTPAATLRQGNVDPSLLASTPDANTTDPFIQEEAAKLDYNWQNIFNFLHTEIAYNSYTGSLRGARGTLWSSDGNALDDASLGVALERASGIPAQYVSGTLTKSQAQQLILSMFPASYQTVGYIPAGTQTSDPANDPQLLSETESHYWFQFDTGHGMTDADPLMSSTVGQPVPTSTGTFTEVPDNLRAKTEVSLTAEMYSQAAAAFGLNPFTDTVVLDQTFNDVDLVGRPITLGFNVTSSSSGFIFTATTNTYTLYLAWGDDAYDSTHDQIITGQSFQDVLTNFPLSSQVVMGLFLNVIESGPQGPSQTYSRALLDRIGYAARQGSSSTSVSLPSGSAPAFSNYDTYTLDVSAAAPDPHPTAELDQQLQANAAEVAALQGTTNGPAIAEPFIRGVNIDLSRGLGNNFLTQSQLNTNTLAHEAGVVAYYDRPRVVMISQVLVPGTSTTASSLSTAIDILNDSPRVQAAPGSLIAAPYVFNLTRGLFENLIERDTVAALAPAGQSPQVDNTYDVFNAAVAQGIGFTEITRVNLAVLNGLNIPDDDKARITTDVLNGFGVIVPNQSVMLNGTPTIAWAEINLATGEYIGVDANGGHQGAFEFLAMVGEGLELQAEVIKFFAPVAGIDAGEFLSVAFELAAASGSREAAVAMLREGANQAKETFKTGLTLIEKIAEMLKSDDEEEPKVPKFLTKVVDQIKKALPLGEKGFNEALNATVLRLTGEELPAEDPEITGILSSLQTLSTVPANQATGTDSVTSQLTPGANQGTIQTASLSVSNQLAATWSSTATSASEATTLSATGAAVVDSTGKTVGTGSVALAAPNAVTVAVAGSDQYSVNGTGTLSFYGPAETNLGVSGNWDNYTATVTGNVSITLTVPAGALTLNGQALPAGTYTITTNSATLSGSGNTTSPNFAGSASITATNGTVNLGAGSGNVTVGGKSLDVGSGATLDGYSGSITVAAGGGNNPDDVTLHGNAANVLTVSATPNTLTTDQNTPVTFQANVDTSFADTYNLTAQAPPGWTVTIDSKGNITATPAPGLQGGTYSIQIIAQSTTNPNLVAQTTVNVAITPTQPGMTLAVNPDPLFTVPFNGAQLPTAFQAVIHNTGPTADTYNLTFANVPSGFTILNSGTSVTVPAGQTGIVGIYLQPNTSQPIPSPGTQLSFNVTATSTSNPAITQSQTVNFTMPNVDAVNLTSTSSQVSSTPGTPTTDTITLTNAGNVSENVTLAATTSAGLTVSGLNPVTLATGQTTTEIITLTPDAGTALNSTLQATITATFGPTANPQTSTVSIGVLVRSPQTVAISQAATAASSGNNTQLANTLSELSDAVSQLQATPTDPALLQRVQLLLGDLNTLLGADPALASFLPQLQPIQAKASSGDVAGMLALLPPFFSNLSGTLSIEAAQQFSVSLSSNYVDMQTGQNHTFQVQLTNTGTDSESLTLSTPNLPSGMTASFSDTQVTLAPGATDTETLTLTDTTLANKVFTLDVSAAASVVQHTATAVVAVRQATADVLGVTVTPQTVNAGTAVAVSAQVFNTANVDRNILAHVDVLDNTGAVVMSLPDIPATLVPGTDSQTLSLGNVDTTALANGIYYVKVSLRAADGTPLPGKSSQAAFEVGIPVTASISASPTLLPPGTSNVTTTITVANQASDPSGLQPAVNSQPDDQVEWVGKQSGNWDDASNWLDSTTNTAKVPGAKDVVTINAPGVTVTVQGTQQALGLQLAAGTTLTIANGATLQLGGPSEIDGSLNLSGTLVLASGDLTLKGDTQWNDGGIINLDGHEVTNTGTLTLTNTNSVALYANGFFNGSGGGDLGGRLVNSGTIVQQGAGPLTLYDSVGVENLTTGRYAFAGDGSLVLGNDVPAFANTGTIIKTAGSGISSIDFLVDNRGIVEVDSGTLAITSSVSQVQANQLTAGNWIARQGAKLSLPGDITFSRASLTLDGAGSTITNITNLAQNVGTFTITDGANFTTTGDLSNSGALTIGPDSKLTVKGNYTQTGGATLDIELGGASATGQFGQLVVTGSASLAGMFLSQLANGYDPAAGESFTVATIGSSSGSFSPVYLAQTASAAFQAAFNSNSIVLNAQAARLIPTSLTLTSSAPNGANWGDQTTFSATVAPTTGSGTPTGSIQFVVDGSAFGTPVPLTNGSASFTTSLELGPHAVTAFYLSDNTTFANSDDSANPLIQVINQGKAPPLVVEVGYADSYRPNAFFPSPWIGSPNTIFVGDASGTFDSGAILITNNSNAPITLNDVSVTLPNGSNFDLWGSNVVPAGGNLILAQTSQYNFDTSDAPTLSYPQTYPDGETAHAAAIDITVNGVLLPTFLDTGHVLTTGGSDPGNAGVNEALQWRLVGTTGEDNPNGSAASVVVTDNLPSLGYNVDPASISPAPTSSSSSQVVWSTQVLQGVNPSQFQVSGTVTNMSPGEVRQVSTGASVAVTTTTSTGQKITNTISLPPVTVAAEHIISIDPPVQSADRNSTVTYNVTLTNPLSTDSTYTLSTQGLDGFGVNLVSSITVKAGQSVTTPLTVTVPAGAIPGTQAFEVLAQTAAGASDSVEGQLTVQSQVDVPSLAVNMTLTPAKAAAGQGDSAVYTLTLTNVGDTTDTYTLSGSFPKGVAASFSQPTITVPPGVSNFRDVTLILTPQVGTAAGDVPFTVTATSTTDSTVSTTANGTLTVLSQGVSVSLTPSSAAPGSTFQMTVTNTGAATDTFRLALGGPAALVAQLTTNQVTLAAGASQTVNITTGAVNFAVQGPLTLTATATSQTNPAATGQATAALSIPATTGLTANATPSVQVVRVAGTGSFLVLTNNTGNSEDAYSATITGTSGPVTATLLGLDGQPTQSVPLFRLPGLSTGALMLQTNLNADNSGTVTVQIQSLDHPNLTQSVQVTVNPPSPPPPPSPLAPPALPPSPPAVSPPSAPSTPVLVGLSSAFDSQGQLATVALYSNGDLDLLLPGFSGLIDTGVQAANLYTDAQGNFGLIVVLQGSGATFAIDSTGTYFLGQGLLNISPAFNSSGQPTLVDTSPSLQTLVFVPSGAALLNLGSIINAYADGTGGLGANIIAMPNGMLVEVDSHGVRTLPAGVMDAVSAIAPGGWAVLDLVMNNGQGLLVTPAGPIDVNQLRADAPAAPQVAAMGTLINTGLSLLADVASIVDQPAAPPVFAVTDQLLADLSALAADMVSVMMQPGGGLMPSLGADLSRLEADLALDPLSGQLSDFLTMMWMNDLGQDLAAQL